MLIFTRSYSSSRINTHLMFPLFPENRKSVPKLLVVKKSFKKCNPPDFKFYPSKLTISTISPYGVMLDFLFFVFCIVYYSEIRLKMSITPYGENFITELIKIKFKLYGVTFLNSFYHKEIMGLTSGFPEITETSSAH